MRIRLRNIERFYAIILLSTFRHPYFFSVVYYHRSLASRAVWRGRERGNKANLLTLNRRGGVAARIKLRGWVPTTERRRRYRRNDYFPRGLTSDFVVPRSQTRSRTANFYVHDWSTVNAEKPGVLYVSRTARNHSRRLAHYARTLLRNAKWNSEANRSGSTHPPVWCAR